MRNAKGFAFRTALLRGSLLVLAALLGFAPVAGAQSSAGSISGTVTDATGAVVPGATVTAKSTGKVYTMQTNEQGEFVFPAVDYGLYLVTVEAKGFRTLNFPDVRVEVARTSRLRAQMEVGEVSATVTVEAGTEVIETVNTEVASTVTKQQMTDLPLATRSPLNLVALQPGVAVTTDVRNAIISGVRGQANNVTQDGINVQDNYIRNDGLFAQSAPNVESTGEFTIIANNLSADSGSGLAQVRITTTRGTDQFHGSAFYFHRNDFFNANTWENNSQDIDRERLRQHRFGYSAGGPVYIPKVYDGRNRSYFFTRYEGFRENFSQTNTRTVLSQMARQGIFQYVATSAGTHPVTGAPFAVGDTVQVDLLALSSNTHPLNTITTELINATPLPNDTSVGDGLNTGGFTYNVTGSDPSDSISLRADQKLAESSTWGTHWLEVVWNRFKLQTAPDTFNGLEAPFPSSVTGGNCPGAMCIDGSTFSGPRNFLAVAIHSTLGASMFNEARFGFSRSPVDFLRNDPFPRSYRIDFPVLTDPEQNFLDQGRISPFYTFIDNFSKVWGAHNFKTGFQMHSRNAITFNDAGTISLITLGDNAQSTGWGTLPGIANNSAFQTRAKDIYSGLVGLLEESIQTFNVVPSQGFVPGATRAEHAREREYDFYFQDSWRLHPTFTFNYGVRWEVIRPVEILSDNALQPVGLELGLFSPYPGRVPLLQPDPSITFDDILTGAAPATQLDLVPRGDLWKQDWNNFAPSIGMAWSPNSESTPMRWLFGGPGKGVLRAGFSTSFVREGLTVAIQPLRSNDGMVTDAGNSAPVGVLSSATDGGAPITTPAFSLPVDQLNNWVISGANSGLFTFDPNMRTPYVLQWTLGFQREIAANTRFEVRYVGNHAVKLIRGLDIGEINVTGNGLLNDFQIAQNNLAIHRAANCGTTGQPACNYSNQGLAGQMPLPILDAIGWTGFSSLVTSSARIGNLDRNEAGEFMHQVMRTTTFNYFASSGATFPGLGTLPANFFRVNPFTFFDDLIGNNSNSNYHALQMEMVRRFSNGLFLQGNYTFGKAISDFDGDVQNTFRPFLTIQDGRNQRARASYDIRHSFNVNGLWQIPVGLGRRYASQGILGRVLEGWQVGGIWTWRSGRPLGFFSGRGTLNTNARSGTGSAGNPAMLVGGMTANDVCSQVGVYREAGGAFFLPASFREATGEASASVFGHPSAGQVGSAALRFACTGPSNFNVDLNLLKRTSITEQLAVEFRAEFFNIFNTPNFLPVQNTLITSTTFSQITNAGTTFSPREIQFNIRVLW